MSIQKGNKSIENKEKPFTESEEKSDDEQLVLLQFNDVDDANYSQQFTGQLKSIDIANPKPIIQIGNRLYSGEYANNLGTYLFFEEKEKSDESTAAVTSSAATASATNSEFTYSGKSFKKLTLTRLFVEENIDTHSEASEVAKD